MPEKRSGILLRPQVDVDCVDLVQIFLLIPLVEARNVPLLLPLDIRPIHDYSEERGLLMRVRYPCRAQIAREGILIGCPGMVGYLHLRLLGVGIVEQIEVAAFGETMVLWS